MSTTRTGTSTPTRPVPPGGGTPPTTGGDGPDPGPAPGAPPRRATVWGLALIALGGLWTASLLGLELRWELILPACLLLVGLAILFRPRGGDGGLTALGMVLLVLSLVVVLLPGTTSFSAGDRTHTVGAAADLADDYGLGAGTLVLDLRGLELTQDAEVSAQVGMGDLVVQLPDDIVVDGRARVGLGEVEAFARTAGGVNPVLELTDPDAGAGPVLTLDLRVGLGQIEVDR